MRPLAIVRAALLVAAAAIATIVPAAPAQAPAGPAVRFAVGSPAMEQAQAIARAHWGVDPCGGEVEITWKRLGPNVNALSSWTVTGDAYEHPETNHDCRIELSTAMDFTWPKFCTVLVHEYGHLVGRPHDEVPGRLMSPLYTTALDECAPRFTRRASASSRRATLRRAG